MQSQRCSQSVSTTRSCAVRSCMCTSKYYRSSGYFTTGLLNRNNSNPSRSLLLHQNYTQIAQNHCINANASSSNLATASNNNIASVDKINAPVVEFDKERGMHKLVWTNSLYNVWTWRDRYRIHWVSGAGLQSTDTDDDDDYSSNNNNNNNEGPIVLLVHGFGASTYHWRYILPALCAAGCRVYAIDCLGFGMSDKALVDYEGYDVWKHQISDFIKEVIHAECGKDEKVCLVGNSLGGYNSLATAASFPHLVESVVLLNGAGRFDFSSDSDSTVEVAARKEEEETLDASHVKNFVPKELPEASISDMLSSMPMLEALGSILKRFLVGVTFIYTKQPARVKQVLRQVYWNDDQIDDDLVESILAPAQDPKAASVFYRVITSKGRPLNRLLDAMERHEIPLFLLWGSKDPWCVPANADRIQKYYSKYTTRVDLDSSGHCPHDDTPMEVVNEILRHVNIV